MSTTISAADVIFIRDTLDLDQDGLAERVGVQRTAVSHWETGIRTPSGPSALLLGQLKTEAKIIRKKRRR